MKSAFALLAVTLLGIGCGGEAAPAKTPDTATPPADPPADSAPADKAADAAGADKPGAKADDEGAWAGEAEAKNAKAPEGSGKTETRTMDVNAKIVKDNRQPVRDCFEKAKKDLPDLKGDMVIHFVIDPDGKVKKADLNVERSTLKAPPVVDCAIKVLQGIKFPPSSRGMDTTINYPYNLN
ncbi:MAG TPA: AgmX/PglI C-terminal domain-containing protein [Polyangiaceae bacterium]|nr:AgmX/PglI C-terminal domain-containing protein [Polyangiaceae bacterium]